MAEFPSSSWKDYELLESGELALRDKFDKAPAAVHRGTDDPVKISIFPL